jgi:hypothetical protein
MERQNTESSISALSFDDTQVIINFKSLILKMGPRHAVASLVEALCYKPEGFGFDSRCGHLIFFFQFT